MKAQVTTSLTLAATVLGYGVGGTSGATVTGLLTLLSLPAAALTDAFVQYLKAGTLQDESVPSPAGAEAPAMAGPAPSQETLATTGLPLSVTETDALGGWFDGATFWGSLTQDERQALLLGARPHLYRKDDILCQEGGPAHEVIVILSGWIRVWVQEGPEQRILAFRGAGELVGERAALMIRARSATVTAEGDVQAVRVGAHAFAAFLGEQPRVRAVLEEQVYRRQTEERAPRDQAGSDRALCEHSRHERTLYDRSPYERAALYDRGALDRAVFPAAGIQAARAQTAQQEPRQPSDWSNGNCSVLITDITGFSSPRRTDDDRCYVLDCMYRLLEESFAASGIVFSGLYQEDRGDGALVIVPPAIPTEAVIDPMLAHLAAELRRHNRRAAEATRLQLRAALHVGPVQRGPNRVSGMSIITTRRLVDAPAVRKKVAETRADLAFVTSDFVFDSVIKPGPGLVDPGRYSRVRVRVKETSLSAWMMLEGGSSWLKAV